MEIKAKLSDLLHRVRAEQESLVADLSEVERAAIGTAERWAVKDVIVHVTAWNQQLLLRLGAAATGGAPPSTDDFEEFNLETFKANCMRPWSEVLADAEDVFGELNRQVASFSEEELADPQRYLWLDGRPLWRTIAGTGYSHVQTHIAQVYLERGDLERATEIEERMAEAGKQMDEGAVWHGIVDYNLACFYAKSGRTERALAKLGEALRLNPELVEWSREDPDLKSLHGEPGYESLYIPPFSETSEF